MLSPLESDFLVPNATFLVLLLTFLVLLVVIVIPIVALVWVALGRRARSRDDQAADRPLR